tara:strand:- start:12751 stop:14013 length:1263 start_codon:yes stop_codon:yes gene_type:complete
MTALATLTSMASAARSIGPAFEMAGQAIKNTITEVWNWFNSTFLDPVLEGAQNIGNALSTAFSALTDPIGYTSGLLSGFFTTHIDEAKVLEEAVLAAFNKEWDQMLNLEEQPEWMTPDLWQKLQEEASVMAAQDWDGMLNLDEGKPDWMTNELWEELGKKGREAAEQEWYSYYNLEKKPDWMDEESWQRLQDTSAGMADQQWEDFLELGTKPDWMTDELWQTLSNTIATEGKMGAEKLAADWDELITSSDEPEWSKEEFWKNASGEIRNQIDLAYEHIKRKSAELATDLINKFMEPFNMLTEMTGDAARGVASGFSGGGGIVGGFIGGVASLLNDAVMGPVGYSRVLSGPEGTFAFNDKDTIVAGTNLGGGGGSTFNINVNASGITDRTDKRQLAREIGNMIQQEMSRSIGGTTMRGRYG